MPSGGVGPTALPLAGRSWRRPLAGGSWWRPGCRAAAPPAPG